MSDLTLQTSEPLQRYREGYQSLTLYKDGAFTLEHINMGIGMHDATRQELWTATGTFTQSDNTITLKGRKKGRISGSTTNVPKCRVDNYSYDIDEEYDKAIDISKWSVVSNDSNEPYFRQILHK